MNTKGIDKNKKQLTEVIKGFIFHCRFEKNLTDKTIKAYETDLFQFEKHMKRNQSLINFEDITRDTLKDYLQIISHFKPKTVKRKVASLKAMFNYFEYEQDNYINPFRKIKVRLKEPLILPSVMSLDEVKKIFNFMYHEIENNPNKERYTYKSQIRNLAITEILFSTGMRVSEVCQLKHEDINLKTGVIKILGKGNKERIIQICQTETLNIIRRYYKLHKEYFKEENSFFINRLGLPVSTQSVRLMIKSYVQKIGFTKTITPHVARHTFATLLLEEDVDIKYIQNMLGHSSIAITQIYTHVNMSKQKKILTTKHPRRRLQFAVNN